MGVGEGCSRPQGHPRTAGQPSDDRGHEGCCTRVPPPPPDQTMDRWLLWTLPRMVGIGRCGGHWMSWPPLWWPDPDGILLPVPGAWGCSCACSRADPPSPHRSPHGMPAGGTGPVAWVGGWAGGPWLGRGCSPRGSAAVAESCTPLAWEAAGCSVAGWGPPRVGLLVVLDWRLLVDWLGVRLAGLRVWG